MLTLFNHYKSNKDYSSALLVGQNLFNNNRANKEVFNAFFELLILLGLDNKCGISERQRYVQQAEVILSVYAENVTLNENVVSDIRSFERKLTAAVNGINKSIEETQRLFTNKKVLENDRSLSLIEKVKNNLSSCNQTEFNKRIAQIGIIDSVIDKEYLTKEQEAIYNQLTSNCQKIVEDQMRKFEHSRNVEYNIKAIEAYEKVFVCYRNDEVGLDHKEILKCFFAFDASRLFNETLVYYNHVYSYVLGKLDDDAKFALTKLAIVSERLN